MDISTREVADLLLRRETCLRSLTDTPRSKTDMVEALDIPRSTLDDIVRELEAAALVEYRGGKWRPTLFGSVAMSQYTGYRNVLEDLTETAPIIRTLPPQTPIDRRVLTGAAVHVAAAPVPADVMATVNDAIESATRIRAVTPMAGYAESFYAGATTGTRSQLEVVFPEKTFERLGALYPDRIATAVDEGSVTVCVGPVSASFSMWIADDDHVGLIVYADQGIRGILINDTDDALVWATEQYDRIRSGAEPVS